MTTHDTLRFSDVARQIGTVKIAERFFDSLILFGLFELGVFARLADGPRALEELHADVGGECETLRAILDAAVAVELLSLDERGYAAPEELLACLGREDSPIYLGEWMTFLHALVGPLSQQAETVRTGRPPGSMIEGTDGDTAPARAMTRAMDAYARTRGAELGLRVDFSGARTLLDVGCGPGTYSLAILERHPELRATLVDLPGPITIAERLVIERGLADRVTLVAEDALRYTPEGRFDAVLVSNMLHMIGPDASPRLLARCLDVLEPGGRLIVQAEYLDAERTSPRWATLLNLILRVTTPEGRNHSVEETAGWLRAAGFVDVEHVRFSPWNVNSVVIGTRPAAGAASRTPEDHRTPERPGS